MIWLISLAVLAAYAALAEYVVHRWVMHVPLLGSGWWWREHALEHHRKGRNDINVELGALSPLFTASPMLMLAVVLGWPWVATVLTTCILYSALWSSLHAAYHGKNDGWVTRLAIYARWKEHHLRHHEYPNRNFGTVFIFTDRIFGTKHLQSSSSAA